MSKKGGKQALTNDELLAQFDELSVENAGSKKAEGKVTQEKQEKSEQDLLAELQDLASQRPASPRVSSSTPRSPNRTSTATPPGRSSEDKAARKSADSSRPYHTSITPADTTSSEAESTPSSETATKNEGGGGGGWWGGLFATATAAVKQAEAAVKEIQNNEEAQRWADQVRGNVGALRGLGTFTVQSTYRLRRTMLANNRCCNRRRATHPRTSNFHLSYPHSSSANLIS